MPEKKNSSRKTPARWSSKREAKILARVIAGACDVNQRDKWDSLSERLRKHLNADDLYKVQRLIYSLCLGVQEDQTTLNQRSREYTRERDRILRLIDTEPILRSMFILSIERWPSTETYRGEKGPFYSDAIAALLKEAYPLSSVYELVELPEDGRGRPSTKFDDTILYRIFEVLQKYFGKRPTFESYPIESPYQMVAEIVQIARGEFKSPDAIRKSLKRGSQVNLTK